MLPLLISLVAAPAADWYRDAVFYQVYVRSFADSDGDGHGDLPGLIGKLDAIEELGATGLWLMPIFEGPSEHGYAVSDFDAVERDYGTMQDVKRVFAEANKRGIQVILDYVPNHVSSEHPWFRSRSNRFVFRDDEPKGWGLPWNPQNPGNVWSKHESGRWYYHAFTPDMPDLNLRDAQTRTAMLDVPVRWVRRGAAGFRVDAVRYLYEAGPGNQSEQPETFAFVRELRKRLDAQRAMMVVEAWAKTDVAARYVEAGAHLAFDFDRTYALKKALDTQEVSSLESAVARAEAITDAWAVFVTNHDCPVPRAASNGRDAAVLANAAVLLAGGVPFLYQGDEIAMRGISEHQVRRPYRWDGSAHAGFSTKRPWREIGGRDPGDHLAAQRRDPRSPWNRTRALIDVRKKNPALIRGKRVVFAEKGPVWGFIREHELHRIVVLLNFSDSAARAKLPKDVGRLTPLLEKRWRRIGRQVELPGYGIGLWVEAR